VLLQVLDDGRLTDSQGRTVDFRNTVVIMTTNATDLEHTFRPEFLNRIDEIIEFKRLGKEHLARIVAIQLARYGKLLAERGLGLRLTEQAVALIAERGYDPVYGARPLKRVLQKMVIDPLATKILTGEVHAGELVVADATPAGDAITFRREEAKGAAA
jgi:ATP-dependent Clp protease ATP-binding subunit ClpB